MAKGKDFQDQFPELRSCEFSKSNVSNDLREILRDKFGKSMILQEVVEVKQIPANKRELNFLKFSNIYYFSKQERIEQRLCKVPIIRPWQLETPGWKLNYGKKYFVGFLNWHPHFLTDDTYYKY